MNHCQTVRYWEFCFLLAVSAAVAGCGNPPPGDRYLIKFFECHRRQFEALVEMMMEDTQNTPLHRIASDYVQYDMGEEDHKLSEERIMEYRRMFSELGFRSMSRSTHSEDCITIIVYAEGWSPEGGIYKGYRFFPDGFPERLEDSLVDSLVYNPGEYEPGTWLHRRIDENWCLWFLY